MRCVKRPFSGRLIFDHFPKTAGQAINAWLTEALGNGTVSPNLIGSHAEILRASGNFPIVSGHVFFSDGEQLDPRFQYATLLREPVDRSISWLYFVTRNHRPADLPELFEACRVYLESEGEELPALLEQSIVNPAVAHFAAIRGSRGLKGLELVDVAYRAILDYDCVGVFEQLNDFLDDFAALIGIPPPHSLRKVNATKERPRAEAVSAELRKNIAAITDLDRLLYKRVAELVGKRRLAATSAKPPRESKWARYDRPASIARTTASLTVHAVRALHAETVLTGAVLQFDLEFELHEPVQSLEIGLHIHDDRERCAFGVNNVLLDEPFSNLPPGRYRAMHFVKAELPAGDYTVGFAFAEAGQGKQRSLYWNDAMLPVRVRRSASSTGVGSAACIARIMLVQWDEIARVQRELEAGNPQQDRRVA